MKTLKYIYELTDLTLSQNMFVIQVLPYHVYDAPKRGRPLKGFLTAALPKNCRMYGILAGSSPFQSSNEHVQTVKSLDYFRMERDWQNDLLYSELVYSFIFKRERRAKAIWEDFVEKGSPAGGGWNANDIRFLEGLRQWVRLPYTTSKTIFFW